MESTNVGANGLRKYSKKEIEEYIGDYDNDGFYILKNKDFFDPYGFYFNTEGQDLIGGFYCESTGVYISPHNYDEDYQDYYDELCGSESDDDENGPEEDNKKTKVTDEYNIPENDAQAGMHHEHCIPVLQWLK